jgi:hypothetical protein
MKLRKRQGQQQTLSILRGRETEKRIVKIVKCDRESQRLDRRKVANVCRSVYEAFSNYDVET